MALAERRDCKDYVSVFVCDDWHLLRVSEVYGQYDIFNSPKAKVYTLSMWQWRCRLRRHRDSGSVLSERCFFCKSIAHNECGITSWQHFETETQDLAGLEWSPNGCVLAVWDSCLEVSHADMCVTYIHWISGGTVSLTSVALLRTCSMWTMLMRQYFPW